MARDKDSQTEIPKLSAKEVELKQNAERWCEYDLDQIFNFLERVVFHSPMQEDENVLTWATKKGPAYPISESKLEERLGRTKQGMACYYATSTAGTNPEDGKLYNRKSLFKRLHVVVLDDIGTKVPHETLPEGLEPTYIIETSAGNFQWGFVLETPLDNIHQADALIHAVYTSGLSDGGGKLVSKLVRLPCGVNGKVGPYGDFKVRLIKGDGPRWEPQAMLNAMGIDLKWSEVEKDAGLTMRSHLTRKGQVSQWLGKDTSGASMNGFIDPLLEWFYERKQVAQETDEWVTIRCPWHDTHTTGDQHAGYSPAGWGSRPDSRGFHCFHDHCKSKTFDDLIGWVAAQRGPIVPRFETANELTQNYVLDHTNKGAWQLDRKDPKFLEMASLKYKFSKPVTLINPVTLRPIKASPVDYWLGSSTRVEIDSVISDPSSTELIYRNDEDRLVINTFTRPFWHTVEESKEDVDMFLDFIGYLLPDKADLKFFMNWLASKIKNPMFKGAAIVMVARQQGTGRGTLTKILEALLGVNNCQSLPFNKLIGGDDFAEWQSKLLVTCDETLSLDNEQKQYRVYEMLKEMCDPAPKWVEINPKYGARYKAYSCTSMLFYSNHLDAMNLPAEDRRFYVLQNGNRRNPEYFTRLYAWLEKGDWVRSVWGYLRDYDLGDFNGQAPVAMTETKRNMIKEATNAVTRACQLAVELWDCPLVSVSELADVVMGLNERLHLNLANSGRALVRRKISELVTKVSNSNGKVAVSGGSTRIAVVMSSPMHDELINAMNNGKYDGGFKALSNARAQFRTLIEADHYDVLRADIIDAMRDEEY